MLVLCREIMLPKRQTQTVSKISKNITSPVSSHHGCSIDIHSTYAAFLEPPKNNVEIL